MSRRKNETPLPFPAAYDAVLEHQKNTFGHQLREARIRCGISQTALAEELHQYNIFVLPPAVNKWEQGLTLPNPYQVFAICRLLHIEDGVRFFSGPLSPDENALNEEGLQKLRNYREDLIASGKYQIVEPECDTEEEIEERLYDLPVSAGTGMFLDSEDYETIMVKKSTVPANADFALRVRGDSMMPNYRDGQLVWVQSCQTLRPGEIGIFVRNDSAYMKMYTEASPEESEVEEFTSDDGTVRQKIVLVSLNSDYDPIVISPYDTLSIVGRVLN